MDISLGNGLIILDVKIYLSMNICLYLNTVAIVFFKFVGFTLPWNIDHFLGMDL
jgi:hypothetical protein